MLLKRARLLPSLLAGPVTCASVKHILHAWQTRARFIEVDYLSWPLFIHVFRCFQTPPFGVLLPSQLCINDNWCWNFKMKSDFNVLNKGKKMSIDIITNVWKCLCYYAISYFGCMPIMTPTENVVNRKSALTVCVPDLGYTFRLLTDLNLSI